MVTTLVLRRAGYEVVLADGANEALARLRDEQTSPHVVLVDVSSRAIDGPAVLADAAAYRPDAAVLALGDHPPPGPECADGYVRKPYAVPDLLEAITGALVARS